MIHERIAISSLFALCRSNSDPLALIQSDIKISSLNKYSITDEPLFEVADITNPYWGNTFTDAIAITVDEVESTLVTYL